jgi:hypothetical protein
MSFKDKWTSWTSEGFKIPLVYDSSAKGQSVTLTFACTAFFLLILSLIALHFFPSILQATGACIAVWVISLVIYRIRRMDRFKMTAGGVGIEVGGEDSKDKQCNGECEGNEE